MIGQIEAIHEWTPPSGPIATGRVNRIPNPHPAASANTWADLGTGVTVNTLAPTTAWSQVGDGALEYKATNSTGSSKNAGVTTPAGKSGMPVQPGESLTLSMVTNLLETGGATVDCLITWYDAAGVQLTFPDSPDVSSLGVHTLELVAVAPEKAAFASVRIRVLSLPNGKTVRLYLDAVMFTDVPGEFFPTPRQENRGLVEWSGIEHESSSSLFGPAVALNRLTDATGQEVWPRWRVTRITGLRSQGTAEENKSARVGGTGETPERSERRGKSVVYEGFVEAKTLKELREAEDVFLDAFADISAVGRMDVFWHELNGEFKGEAAKFYEAKCLTGDIPDQQETKDWKRRFVLGLWMYDPRHFDEETETHTVKITLDSTTYTFA